MKILIVDDNFEDRKLLRYVMEKNHHEVIEAENGADGLKAANSISPDLIVSDALMPVMDGFQFLHAVKRVHQLCLVPFIFYSASYRDSKDVRLALSLGADGYLIKPMEPTELWQRIQDILEKRPGISIASGDVIQEDSEYLKNYNEVVVAKLEHKVRELEHSLEERKRIAQEKEQMCHEVQRHKAELERMFYVFGHDLRSPLVNLQGFSKELDDQVNKLLAHALAGELEQMKSMVEKEIPESLHFIASSTQKLALYIEGMLRIGRTGQAVFQIQPLDCNAILSGILESIRWQIDVANATLCIGDLPPCMGDTQWITHAFGNLLDNALKYRSSERRLQIEVLGHREGDFCLYDIRDNGQGIRQEDLPHIWELFFRSMPKHGCEGEGLGLTMVRNLVERHGGSISVESREGEGTCFTVRLPSCPA